MDSESNGAVSTAEARQSVQDIVDRTASSLEGDWEVYSGPSVEQCSKSDGQRRRCLQVHHGSREADR